MLIGSLSTLVRIMKQANMKLLDQSPLNLKKMKSLYVLKGKAIIDDLIKKSHVDGDEIMLDMSTGSVDVKGSSKKPVKFIFDMEDKE